MASTARDRHGFILDALTKSGHVEIDELAGELGVSTATIRRDLDRLAKSQLLIRTRGGAATNSSTFDLPLKYNALKHPDEKRRIAFAAASRITPHSVVGFNAGTTTTEVSRVLATMPEFESEHGEKTLTIVTNAVNIAHELTVRAQFELVVLGGTVRPESYELTGPMTERGLADLALDRLILSANALDTEFGVTASNIAEAAVARAMISRAAHVTLVMDSSKLGQRSFASVCPIRQVDVLITDEQARQHADLLSALHEAGTSTVLV